MKNDSTDGLAYTGRTTLVLRLGLQCNCARWRTMRRGRAPIYTDRERPQRAHWNCRPRCLPQPEPVPACGPANPCEGRERGHFSRWVLAREALRLPLNKNRNPQRLGIFPYRSARVTTLAARQAITHVFENLQIHLPERDFFIFGPDQ